MKGADRLLGERLQSRTLSSAGSIDFPTRCQLLTRTSGRMEALGLFHRQLRDQPRLQSRRPLVLRLLRAPWPRCRLPLSGGRESGAASRSIDHPNTNHGPRTLRHRPDHRLPPPAGIDGRGSPVDRKRYPGGGAFALRGAHHRLAGDQ